MRRPVLKLWLIVAITTATAASGAEVESFSVEAGITYGYAIDESRSMQSEIEIAPAIELTLSPQSSLIASARIKLDEQDELEPGQYGYDSYSEASRPISLGSTGSAEIRDFYFEFRTGGGLVRLGKQQIVWGRLDGIKVLDLVNPQDFREFISDDFYESRIGLWSAYFDYSFGDWRAELAVVPDGTGHAIPERGAWYELTAPRFRFGARPNQGSLPLSRAEPGMSLDNTAIGLRLSRQLGDMEFSTVAYSGKDPEPLGRIVTTGSEATLESFYKRREALGLSFDLGLGPAIVRAEYAYHPGRVFNLRSNQQLTTLARDQHRAALGMDVNGPLGVFVNIQYLVDIVSEAPTNLVRPAADRIGTLYLRRTFAYETAALEARWYQSFTDHDQQLSVNFTYALSDSTTIKLGAQHSSGTTEGLFGQFVDRDRVTLSLRHTF